MSPRMENHIQELCAKAISAKEDAEMEQAIKELRAALSEHIQRLREQVNAIPIPERRSGAAD
ncbi:MAG TPA: hypothetical protein VFA74_15525 [Terriglobales bacterium]|nr:hypothetical protein [Terriglobales bacterium]